MQGVTILSETVVSPCIVAGIFILICSIVAVLFMVACIVYMIKYGELFPMIIPAIVCLLAACAFGYVSISELNKQPYTKYKVTVDDSVSFKEFTDKYEILNQDGLVYEVRERGAIKEWQEL